MRLEHRLDVRYSGQAYELSVPAEGDFISAFHHEHERRYGYKNVGRKVKIVNVRCRATGMTEKIPTVKIASRKRGECVPPGQKFSLVFGRGARAAKLYAREELCAGDGINGPAVVMEYSATTLVTPSWRAEVDAYGQLIMTRK